jgi:hypothetical protein
MGGGKNAIGLDNRGRNTIAPRIFATYDSVQEALYIAARARQILSRKLWTLAHEEIHRTTSIHHHPKQLKHGGARGEHEEFVRPVLVTGESSDEPLTVTKGRPNRVAAASPPWIISSTESE